MIKQITSYLTKHAAGKIFIRVIGFPAAVAAGTYSALRTWQEHKNLKEFDKKNIAPLRQESEKWQDAKGQLEGAVHELTYYERYHYPHTRYAAPGAEPNLEIIIEDDDAENQHEKMVERHYPDPIVAYDLVVRAKNTLADCNDLRKDEVLEMLESVEKKLDEEKDTKKKGKYKRLRNKMNEIIDELKYVISDYNYDISKLKKQRIDNKWKWGLATAASAVGAAFGIKAFKKTK